MTFDKKLNFRRHAGSKILDKRLSSFLLENGEQKLITTLMMTFVEYFGSCLRTFKFSSKIVFIEEI